MTIECTEKMPRTPAKCQRILILHLAPRALLKLDCFERRMEAAGLASDAAHVGNSIYISAEREHEEGSAQSRQKITPTPSAALLLRLNLESLYELSYLILQRESMKSCNESTCSIETFMAGKVIT